MLNPLRRLRGKFAIILQQIGDLEFNKLEFAIFCIENVAEALGIPGNIAYRKLAIESNMLSDYIFKHFDILHTQGSAWIREDLLSIMRKKGLVT